VLEAANARIAGVPRVDLLGGRGLRDFVLQGEVSKAEVSQVSVHQQPFGEATRLRVKEASGSEWSVQLQAATTAPVEAGDVLLATFYLRTEVPKEDGIGETSFVFELGQGPFTSRWNTRFRRLRNGPRCRPASRRCGPMRRARRT